MEKTFIKLKSSSRYGLNSPSSWFGSPSLGSGMILSALDFSLSSHFFWEVNQITIKLFGVAAESALTEQICAPEQATHI